jgi:hypothetical protein
MVHLLSAYYEQSKRGGGVMYDVIDHLDSNFKQIHGAIYLVLANSQCPYRKQG